MTYGSTSFFAREQRVRRALMEVARDMGWSPKALELQILEEWVQRHLKAVRDAQAELALEEPAQH